MLELDFENKPDASAHCFHIHLITVSQDKVLQFGYNDFNGGNTGSVPELTERMLECSLT